MKKIIFLIVLAVLASKEVKGSENDLTPRQMIYAVKKHNPLLGKIKILIDKAYFEEKKESIKKALYTYGLKGEVYVVRDNISIQVFKDKLKENETVLVFNLECSKNFRDRIRIINHCMEKDVKIITGCELLARSCQGLGYDVMVLGEYEGTRLVSAK